MGIESDPVRPSTIVMPSTSYTSLSSRKNSYAAIASEIALLYIS